MQEKKQDKEQEKAKFYSYLFLAMAGDVEGFKKAISEDKELHKYRDAKGKNILEIVGALKDAGRLVSILTNHPCGEKLFSVSYQNIFDDTGFRLMKISDTEDVLFEDPDAKLDRTLKTTPLMQFARDRNLAAINRLIQNGNDVTARDNMGMTVLHHATSNKRKSSPSLDSELIKLLLAHGADINAVDNNGNTPLLMAVFSGNVDMVQALLTHNPDLTKKNSVGLDALAMAISDKNKLLTDLLIKKCDASDDTLKAAYLKVLEIVLKARDVNTVGYIFSNPHITINSNTIISKDKTLLIYIVCMGQHQLTKKVLNIPGFGIDVNASDPNGSGYTALHHAAKAGDMKMVRLLLKHGAQNIPAKDNKTPADLARELGQNGIANEILRSNTQTTSPPSYPTLPAKNKPLPVDEKRSDAIAKLNESIKQDMVRLEKIISDTFQALLPDTTDETMHTIIETKTTLLSSLAEKNQALHEINLNPQNYTEQSTTFQQLNDLKNVLNVLESEISTKQALCQKYKNNPEKIKFKTVDITSVDLTEGTNKKKKKKKKAKASNLRENKNGIEPTGKLKPDNKRKEVKEKSHPIVLQKKYNLPENNIRETKKNDTPHNTYSDLTDHLEESHQSKLKRALKKATTLIDMFDNNVYLIKNNCSINPLSNTTIRYLQEAIMFAIVQDLRFKFFGESGTGGDKRFLQFENFRHSFVSKRGKLDRLSDKGFSELYAEFCSYIRALRQDSFITPVLNPEGSLIYLMSKTEGDLPPLEEIRLLEISQIVLDDLKHVPDDVGKPFLTKLIQDHVTKISGPKNKTDRTGIISPVDEQKNALSGPMRHDNNYLTTFFADFQRRSERPPIAPPPTSVTNSTHPVEQSKNDASSSTLNDPPSPLDDF